MIPLAQTLTAQPETFADLAVPLITLLSLLWGALATIRASNKTALLRAAIIGVKAGLDALHNPADKEIVKQQIEAAAGGREAPLNVALKAEVKKTTASVVAYRDDGLPHLGVLFFFAVLLLGAGGCISAAAHNAALAAQESGAILRKASVPDPRYSEADRAAYERLWTSHEAALKAIEETTK